MVGWPVSANKACTVKSEYHWRILQGTVVNHLVIATLQKSGINGHHWLEAVECHGARHGCSVFLGNAHIYHALRTDLRHLVHPSP